MRTRYRITYLLPVLASLLASASSSMAADGPGARDNAVIVNGGVAGRAGDRYAIILATDPLLSPNSASSCGFMAPYNPAYDPVTVAYMRDFGMLASSSYDPVQITEFAPFGDASMPIEHLRGGAPYPGGPGRRGLRAMGACSGADLRFAAGRMHIAMHDKSLAYAFEAFDRQDYVRARELFTEAWNKVDYRGVPALMLARLHLYGLGTPRDTGKAIDWLDKVANDRFGPGDRMRFDPARPDAMSPMIEAAWLLAQIYDHGIGIAPDRKLADKWYARAAEYGFVPALDLLALRGLAAGASPREREKAAGELKQAADAGYAPAQYHLARAYYTGDGVARDVRMAGAYFEAAARAGVPGALFAAGRMVDLGEGVPADPRKALVYYKEAALKGDRDAQFALATFFYSGEVLPKDVATARKWFAAAARQGQPDAMFNLGAMSASGEGGPKDLAFAYVWFSLAKASGHEGADAALTTLSPQLSSQDHAKADAILKPGARKPG